MQRLRVIYASAKQSQMLRLQEILGKGDNLQGASEREPGRCRHGDKGRDSGVEVARAGLEPQGGGAVSDLETGDNMQVSTPTTSVSSESDISEVSDNKGN